MTQPLVRAIGRWTLAALMLNGVIGSSVFGLPSVIAGKLGPASPWAWLAAALAIAIVVACFAEVASRFQGAGGPYLYGRIAFGRFIGIEMGWVALLVRLTASATNANLFVIYLGELWPAAETPLGSGLVLAALLLPLAVVNIRGVAPGSRLSGGLIILKLLPLTAFVLGGLALALPHGAPHPPMSTTPGSWLDAILLLFFAYGGFESALIPLGEARNPERDAPFALGVTLLTCAVLYCLTQVVVLAALPDPAGSTRPLAAAARELVGPAGAVLMALAAMISVYGYLSAGMVNVPRLTYAMARESDLPAFVGAVHPRWKTPAVSIGLYALLVWLLAVSGGFLSNLSLSAISRLFTYGVVCLALPRFRRMEAEGNVPRARLRLPGGALWMTAGLAISLVLATRMTRQELVVMSVTLALGAANWLWARNRPARTA